MITSFNSNRFRSCFFWESLVPGGANLVGSLFNFFGQKSANKANLQAVRETNAANRQLAEYQNEMNLEQWNRENEYNHPIQQMARLQSAGLNPHLVYGSGATTVAAKSPEMVASRDQAPHFNPVSFDAGSVGRGFVEGLTVEQAIKDAIARRDNLAHQSAYVDAMAAKALTDAALNTKDIEVRDELNKYSVEAAKSAWKNLEKDLDVKSQNIAESQQRISQIKANTNLTEAQARKVDKEIDELASRIMYNNAGTALRSAQANKTNQDYEFDRQTWQHRKSQVINTANKIMQDAINSSKTGRLTEAQIDRVEAEIKIAWARLGLDTSRQTSAELRSWIYGWIPGANPGSYTTTTSSLN